MLNYRRVSTVWLSIASPKVAAKGWVCGTDDISYDPPFCAEGPQTFHKKCVKELFELAPGLVLSNMIGPFMTSQDHRIF